MNPTRRELFVGAAGLLGAFVLGGSARAAWGKGDTCLRPPGGQDEWALLSSCIKCDRCRSVCPQQVIAPGTVNDGFLIARSPKLDFSLGYCDFCGGEFRCAWVCPMNALSAFDEEVDAIGLAVIDHDECLAYDVTPNCRKCVDVCPYDAIRLTDALRPVVMPERCNGCGRCEFFCPSTSLRAYSGTGRRGIMVHAEAVNHRKNEGDQA